MLADIEAIWQISKSGLISYLLLGCAGQRFGRKNSDKLHALVSVIELVNMLEEKNRGHTRAAA
jgi:hypothetical protein